MSTPRQDDQNLDDIFYALSDYRRRRVLERLCSGPLIKKELGEEFAMSKPAVGKHIRILERSGLITTSEQGRTHQCELNPKAINELCQWLSKYQPFWQKSLDNLANYARNLKKADQ